MKRPEFIKHYSELEEKDDSHYPNSDELLSIGAPLGKLLGLKKIGIHHETLLPGRRTSWPHAERDEEEFVFVLEGNPQVWVDGHIYDLSPGHAVSFPSGTGIAHTFLNNSDKTARLLVVGEASKKEHKVFYSFHHERNELGKKEGWYWEDHPQRLLGPHDGLPDKLREKKK